VAGNLPPGEAVAAAEQIVGAVGRQEIVDLAQHDLEAVIVQPHVLDDLGLEQADGVAGGGIAKAGRELLRHGRAADDLPGLQDCHLQPGGGEIISADQTIMARTDDHDVRSGPAADAHIGCPRLVSPGKWHEWHTETQGLRRTRKSRRAELGSESRGHPDWLTAHALF
jgi:hypothetical protein